MSTIAAPRAAILGPLRDWLRAQSLTVGQRIYAHRLARDATLPAVSLTKIGLSPDGTTTERALVQFDCWATNDAEAEALAAEVKTTLETAAPFTSDGVRFHGAQIEAEVALPDPDDGDPRYVVTALVVTSVTA